MNFSRRDMGRLIAGGAALLAACGKGPDSASAPAPGKKRIPVSVETWSVKELLAEDPEGIIAQLAQMGYEGIELAHYYRWENLTAPRVRKALTDNGIVCSSAHINLQSLQDDQIERTVEYNKEIGNSVLIIASLPHQETIAGWKDLAAQVDDRAAKAAEYGMRIGYHNHAGDFQPLEGQIPWEVFFDNTRQQVIHQLDVGNMPKEHQEPLKYLKKYPGRTHSIHVKDRSADYEQVLVGEGILPFREIFDLCATIGGTEWFIVEYESKEHPPMEAVRQCLESVRKMIG